MPFELGRIRNKDEGIGMHTRMVAFNYTAGEFLLRRRGNRAVYAGKIDNIEGLAKFRFALSPKKRNGHAGPSSVFEALGCTCCCFTTGGENGGSKIRLVRAFRSAISANRR
jgi:hypothetical protein